uniref:G protein-coupled receptor n=1 Tax=Caenorhabditis tropicalis TaxID=1561998 RepID=A0A1I7UTW7_9PELO
MPEDQEAAQLDSLSRDPCPTVEFFQSNVLVLINDPDIAFFFVYIHTPSLILITLSQISFHVICTVYHLYLVPFTSISIETRRKQQKFFIGIVFQTVIPFTVLVYLVATCAIDLLTYSVPQELINLGMVICAAHGLVESVAVLSVHQSYRMAVLGMIRTRIRRPESE